MNPSPSDIPALDSLTWGAALNVELVEIASFSVSVFPMDFRLEGLFVGTEVIVTGGQRSDVLEISAIIFVRSAELCFIRLEYDSHSYRNESNRSLGIFLISSSRNTQISSVEDPNLPLRITSGSRNSLARSCQEASSSSWALVS